MCEFEGKGTLVIEPFCSGSHQELIRLFRDHFGDKCLIVTLPGKKWHWRARTSALYFAHVIPKEHGFNFFYATNDESFAFRKLFVTSVLNLAELVGLRPDLGECAKTIYFHENQLIYPINHGKSEHDFQYGYSQILSCLCADHVLFNSLFNLGSFLTHIDSYMSFIPSDARIRDLSSAIKMKCQVLYFPMLYPIERGTEYQNRDHKMLQIAWPHRWEHDKNPQLFFSVLLRLKTEGFNFRLVLLGQTFGEKPAVFQEAANTLKNEIKHWGYVQDRAGYFDLLQASHIAVSTANHEFFGVSMLEAAYSGCLPLCPNKLCYPEMYPKECLYNTETQLYKFLRHFSKHPHSATEKWLKLRDEMDFRKYSWDSLKCQYLKFL